MRRHSRLVSRLFILLALLASNLTHAQLPEAVAQALKQAGIPESHVGILVQDLDSPTPLLAHGERRSLNPASVMKLLTTLAALDTLGPAHSFTTRVLVDGDLADGVLHGNLILAGGGDPGLTPERFWLLLRELRARGIREIRGNVVLDSAFYALEQPIDPAAFDQAPLRPYNAPPAALMINFNTVLLRLRAEPQGVALQIDPARAEDLPDVINQVRITDGLCNGWGDQVETRRENGALVVSGSYPLACGDQAMSLNLLSPEATTAAWFRVLWRELGGTVSGGIGPGEGKAEARLVLEFASPPLSELVRDINKFSNNVMAKMLLLDLGAARYGAPATWDKGIRAVRAWAAERDLVMPELVLENGSGLSRLERLSAASLGRLLMLAARRPAYYEFAASLPAVGLEGTQKRRLNDSSAAGQAWLKSGSLNGVRNLAGYVLGPDGHRRIVVFLINHAKASAAGKAQEALVEWVVNSPFNRLTDPNNPECKH